LPLPTKIAIPTSTFTICKFYLPNIWEKQRHYPHNHNFYYNTLLYSQIKKKTNIPANQGNLHFIHHTSDIDLYYAKTTFQAWALLLNNNLRLTSTIINY